MDKENARVKRTRRSRSSLSMLELLTTEEKRDLRSLSVVGSYGQGETLYTEGERAAVSMLLLEGTVKSVKTGPGGREIITKLYRRGDLIGFRGGVLDGSYQSTAIAIEETIVGSVPADAAMEVFQTNAPFAARLMEMLLAEIDNNIRHTLSLTNKHLRGRLADTLLLLKETFGVIGDRNQIGIEMARKDIAAMSNMNTANVIRTLSSFADEGVIEVDRRKIYICDEGMLNRISNIG